MKCIVDQDCGFLQHCTSSLECSHNDVFPLSVETIFIYLLIPFASGLVNSTGHSMGLFKVLIVISILRYQGVQATMVSQALIVGTALPNYFSMLARKHPTMPTSLVNFNLVYILVPCCLLGSTFGSLVTEFIPNLVQQVLTFLVFTYFAWGFYQKYRKIKQNQTQLQSSILTDSNRTTIIQEIKTDHIEGDEKILSNSVESPLIEGFQQNEKPKNELDQEQIKEREKILEYEKSMHLKDILFSVLVFAVFEFLVFLVQGRLPFLKFTHCDWKYWTGISLLIPLTLVYVKFIHTYLKQKFDTYEKLYIQQEIMLNKDREFMFVFIAGILAGLVQGILGLGSGSCMMSFLLTKPINATSASATTGYQVLFIGLASLMEGFINGSVNLNDSVFFILLCFVLGGIVTLAMAHFLQTRNQVTVSKIVVLIAVFLSLVSVVMVVPDVINLINDSGLAKAMEVKFSCDK